MDVEAGSSGSTCNLIERVRERYRMEKDKEVIQPIVPPEETVSERDARWEKNNQNMLMSHGIEPTIYG